jgi:transcription antitermination factor NusG
MEVNYVLVKVMEIDQVVFIVREVPSWVCPIMDFMVNGQVPVDEAEARHIQRRSKGYTIINNEMYKRSATGVLQRCVESAEGQEMLREIQQEECGHHA